MFLLAKKDEENIKHGKQRLKGGLTYLLHKYVETIIVMYLHLLITENIFLEKSITKHKQTHIVPSL